MCRSPAVNFYNNSNFITSAFMFKRLMRWFRIYICFLYQVRARSKDEGSVNRRSLNSNHHLVDFSHALLGRESGQPPAQRANVALMPAAIKSTRLVANANRPEGISAFPVSPYHTTKTTKPATLAIPHQPPYFYTPR